jgi:hypothetical protein
MTNETTTSLAPGAVLGNKYELFKEIERSNMGSVWKAKDRVANRLVALKFLPNELRNDESAMSRIREMFKRVHALHHQSICDLYGLEDGGQFGYYFVIRHLEGQTLAQYAEQNDPNHKGLPLSKVIRILAPVAEALDYAHRNGVIHCGIDPSNIFIAKTDQGTEVLVLDFGLAATIRASMKGKIDLSEVRPYMAPEQWRGQKQTAVTDQYSLAVMTYRLLAGHLPFEGADTEILGNAILNHTPEMISTLPENANAVLQRALAKRGADRFGSCEEFFDDLKLGTQILPTTSTRSVADGMPTPASSGISHKWLIAFGILLLCVLGAIAWGVMGGRDKTPPAEVVVQVVPQPVVVEQIVPPAPPQPAYQSPFRDIFEAAAKGTVRDVEYFVKNGTDVNARVQEMQSGVSDVNWVPLLIVARQRSPNVEVVKYLVSQGADVNMKNGEGFTALHEVAMHSGNVGILQYLISQGADVNVKNFRRDSEQKFSEVTPLHLASSHGHVNAAQVLVSAGANVNAINGGGHTPLDHTKIFNKPEVGKYLESIGARSGR